MGQAYTPGCCSCGGNRSQLDGPIQVIQEPWEGGETLPTDSKIKAAEPSKTNFPLPAVRSGTTEPTAEPEPVPSLRGGLAPVPENSQAAMQCIVPQSSSIDTYGAKLQASSSSDPFGTLESLPSEPFATREFEALTKTEKHSAKQLVKDFVKTMVRGRQFSAVLPTGQVRPCFCALNRALDKLQIRANEKDRQGRTVPLQNIAEIVVGSDKSASSATEGLETPLDNMSVTLVLETDECITFRMEDIESRDKLADCLAMFSGKARTAKRGG